LWKYGWKEETWLIRLAPPQFLGFALSMVKVAKNPLVFS
jgi:hypothetical protein